MFGCLYSCSFHQSFYRQSSIEGWEEQRENSDFYPRSRHIGHDSVSYTLSCAIQDPLLFLAWPPGAITCWSEWSPIYSVPYLQAPCAGLGYHNASQMTQGSCSKGKEVNFQWVAFLYIGAYAMILGDDPSLACLQSTDFMTYAPLFLKGLQKCVYSWQQLWLDSRSGVTP